MGRKIATVMVGSWKTTSTFIKIAATNLNSIQIFQPMEVVQHLEYAELENNRLLLLIITQPIIQGAQ